MLRRWGLRAVIVVVPIGAIILSSAWHAFFMLRLILSYDSPHFSKAQAMDIGETLRLRRSVQRYFSDHGTYIPLEDIQVETSFNPKKAGDSLAMQNQGGKATLEVWIPLRFKFPLMGVKVVEWLWKAELKET